METDNIHINVFLSSSTRDHLMGCFLGFGYKIFSRFEVGLHQQWYEICKLYKGPFGNMETTVRGEFDKIGE